jgi:hypothetical protein
MLMKAQEIYIDSGGMGLSLDRDFQVKLPLIDFSKFKERVDALSAAYADSAISMADYRNALPGIDPLKTERAVEEERAEDEERLVKAGLSLNPNNEEEDDDGEES